MYLFCLVGRYVRETEPRAGPSSLPGTGGSRPGAAGPYDEWSDVRDKLRQDYGDKYFEGERGDTILKPQAAAAAGGVPGTAVPGAGAAVPPPPPVSALRDPDKDKKKQQDRRSFQNVDVIRGDISSARHSKVEYGPADKYQGPIAAVAERAKQAEKTHAPPPPGEKDPNEKPKEPAKPPPFVLRQNSAEEQKRFDNAAMVKDIVEASSVFKKLAAERSPSEESMTKAENRSISKSMESVKSKDVSPTESVHSTVGELIDFSEAKVLHQMGCKFMPELRAKPQGGPSGVKPVLTPEEKAEKKRRKEERRKEREKREREKEARGETAGTEKVDEMKPVVTEETASGSKSRDKTPDASSGATASTTTTTTVPTSAADTKPETSKANAPTSTSASQGPGGLAAPTDKEPDQLSPIAECKENGCEPSPTSPAGKPPVVKKEILTNDVISNANVIPPSNNTSANLQQQLRELSLNGSTSVRSVPPVERSVKGPLPPLPPPSGPGGSPSHGVKGTCIAGHAALTNSTISSHAVTAGVSHSPRCPVHGTPGVPHPLIAYSHPHVPPGHIFMCSAGHAHIAPAHMAAMSQPQYVTTTGPKEVPCPKPPPPPIAPKPKGGVDTRRNLDIVASTTFSRQPPTPPPRISSALSDGAAAGGGGSLSELPPPPPELLSDIHAPPPDLVSNHTPPTSHTSRSPSHTPGKYPAPKPPAGVVPLPAGGAGHLPAEPPSYEAATGIGPGGGYPGREEPDGLYVVADGPPPGSGVPPPAPLRTNQPPPAWQCKKCTFANEPGDKVCRMCCTSRIAGPEVQLISGGAQCPRCTYVNSIGSLMCKVCMQDLQGSPTYI